MSFLSVRVRYVIVTQASNALLARNFLGLLKFTHIRMIRVSHTHWHSLSDRWKQFYHLTGWSSCHCALVNMWMTIFYIQKSRGTTNNQYDSKVRHVAWPCRNSRLYVLPLSRSLLLTIHTKLPLRNANKKKIIRAQHYTTAGKTQNRNNRKQLFLTCPLDTFKNVWTLLLRFVFRKCRRNLLAVY